MTSNRRKKKIAKKVRKKGVNPRSKGKRLEYSVRDIFAEWTGLEFSRTPGSGAFGTTNRMNHLVGDVVAKNGDFAYSLECKNVNSWNLEGFLSSDKSPIWAWWEQTTKQAEASNKIPMLCLKKNGHPIYCVTTLDGTPPDLPNRHFIMAFSDNENFLYVFLLSDLIKTNPKRWIK